MNQKGLSIVLILIAGIALAGLVGGAYYLGKSNIPKSSPTPVIAQTPQPSSNSTIQPTSSSGLSQTVSKLQSILATNCEKIYLQNSTAYAYFIDFEKIPVNIDQNIIKTKFDNPNKLPCTFFNPNKATNYFSINLTDKSEINVYDNNSTELGHGGPSYLGSYQTVIKDDGTTKITITIIGGEGPSIVGAVPVYMRGEKQIKLSNGEILYVNYSKEAIDGENSQLVTLLNQYSKPSEFEQDSRELTSLPNEEIKNAFFSDLSNMQPEAKNALGEIEKILGAVSPK